MTQTELRISELNRICKFIDNQMNILLNGKASFYLSKDLFTAYSDLDTIKKEVENRIKKIKEQTTL